MEQVTCANCGSDNAEILFKKGIFEKGGPVIGFNNVICNNCGLVWRNPRETAEELNELYKNIYLEKRHMLKDEEAAEAFVSELDPKNKGAQIHNFLKDLLNKDSQILDIGSGLGLIGGFLREKYGYKTKGIEPSELSARVSEKKYGMPVFHGTLDAFLASQTAEKFDFIILHHVFEHFADPVGRLKDLRGLLSGKGMLYIEVPNILDFKKPITQFFDFLHLYNYSPKTLSQILEKGGFKIIRWNREKRYRIQVVAAPESSGSVPEVLGLSEGGNVEPARIKAYCRRQYFKEIISGCLEPLRYIRNKMKVLSR